MDDLDWIVRGVGVIACGLLVVHAVRRLNPVDTADTSLAWQLFRLLSLVLWLILLAADHHWPIRTAVYIVNSGDAGIDISVGRSAFCLPGKSYRVLTWRWAVPPQFEAKDGPKGGPVPYRIEAGTWIVNVASTTVSADFLDRNDFLAPIKPDFLSLGGGGRIRVSLRSGRPYRLYSELPLDRAFTTDGDIAERWHDGRCAAVPAEH
jgi:hypothetical protein